LIYQHFLSVLNQQHNHGKVIVAFSGGVDSRVLLHLLAQYRTEFSQTECMAIHVHHGLSQNDDTWAEQCRQWCSGYQIECRVEKVKLELGNQISTEQEARKHRYAALAKWMDSGDLLLTGQHASDQSESFFLALKRGSGPKGLSSMAESSPFQQGTIVRPLLSVTREQVEEFAREQQLDWIEDESNQDTRYDRNFLRHEVMPVLRSRWPSIEQSVLRSAKLCADQEALLQELLQDKLAGMTGENLQLSIVKLSEQSTLARNQLIRMWLEQQSSLMPSVRQLELLWQEVAMASQDANPKLVLSSGEVRRYQQQLYFLPHLNDISGWSNVIQIGQELVLPDNLGSLKMNKATGSATLALRSPNEDEVVRVIFNPEGLSAHPEDRGHSRKLKKLFQEYAIPSWLRNRTPIIMYNDRLATVVNMFVDKDFSGQDCEFCWNKV